MKNLKSQFRWAGWLYLVIFITAGFAEGYVRESLINPNNAVETFHNLQENQGLFRLGFLFDLIAFSCDVAVSIILYQLLKPVNKTLSMTAAAFRLLAHPAIGTMNLLNHLAPVLLVSQSNFEAFSQEQIQVLVGFFFDLHKHGYLIAGSLFGIHCVLLGILIYRSSLFSKWLGVFLAVAGLTYLIESFGNFLAPEYAEILAMVVVIPAVLAELSLCFTLLLKRNFRESFSYEV